jgi:omega-amidase
MFRFISNYDRDSFEANSESIVDYKENDSATAARMLSEAAKEHGVYIIGGSIPEKRDDGWVYNTSACFNKSGDLTTKYSKAHLFDIDIPGKITFKESEFLRPGTSFAIFDTEYCRFGLGI